MHIDSHEALGVLNTVFEILAPSSLRPVDMLLRSMFVTPATLVSTSPAEPATMVPAARLCRAREWPEDVHFKQVPSQVGGADRCSLAEAKL